MIAIPSEIKLLPIAVFSEIGNGHQFHFKTYTLSMFGCSGETADEMVNGRNCNDNFLFV